jgi:hypothetical protein
VEVTPGAIRACVKSKGGKITMYTTQDYKCVSEGYKIDMNPNIDRGLIEIMKNLALTNSNSSPDQPYIESSNDQPPTVMEPTPNEVIMATDELELSDTEIANIDELQMNEKEVSKNIIPFKSRRLNQQVPEYVPAYTPAKGLLLKDSVITTNLVQNQSVSELRGGVEPSIEEVKVLLSLEDECFFTNKLDTSLINNNTDQKVLTGYAKRRYNRKIAKQKMLADAEADANTNTYVPPQSKGMRNGKNSVSMMAYAEIDIEEWKSVASDCGYGDVSIAYQAHLARAECTS